MYVHPFKPLIVSSTKRLLVGTLPPEGASFYFSNSTNTRLWDILIAIDSKSERIGRGGNDLSEDQKTSLLERLNLVICDIIYGYERLDYGSTKDKDIIPLAYNDLLSLARENGVKELLFVYQSALKWFIHSLEKESPVMLSRLKGQYNLGLQSVVSGNIKSIKCILLPSPLNRGRQGETLPFKISMYSKYII